jgi:hypothetical protein
MGESANTGAKLLMRRIPSRSMKPKKSEDEFLVNMTDSCARRGSVFGTNSVIVP